MVRTSNIKSNKIQITRIALAFLMAIASGASILFYPQAYAPLFVGGAMAAVVILFIWLKKPVWAVYTALFVVFLPLNLIPAQLNSLLNRALTIAAVIVWLVDVVARRKNIIWTKTTLIFLGFTIWGIVSLFWANNLDAGLTVLQTYVLRLILFLVLVVNEIRTKKDLDQLINILALSGGLLVLVSISAVLHLEHISGIRLQVLDVNANGLGITLLIMTPAVLYWAMRPAPHNSALKKGLAAVYILAFIVIIAMSGSKGSALSLGITLLAFLFWKPTRSWGILAVVILGLTVIIIPFAYTTLIARFLGMTGDSLLTGREFLWSAGLQLISHHILLGVGLGNSSYEVMPYLVREGGMVSVLALENIAPLHNPILVIWGDTGIPGLLLYLGALVVAVWSFVRQNIRYKQLGAKVFMPYFPLVASTFLGYLASWIKGGGIETDFSYFLILALLIIPSCLDVSTWL